MATHLSVRLVWHDRAWDGHICNHPSKNVYCAVSQHIRDAFSDPAKLKREEDAAAFISNSGIIPQDDPGRVRGCAVAVLKDFAAKGDCLLPLDVALEQIRAYFPERRACNPDRRKPEHSAFYNSICSRLSRQVSGGKSCLQIKPSSVAIYIQYFTSKIQTFY